MDMDRDVDVEFGRGWHTNFSHSPSLVQACELSGTVVLGSLRSILP